MKSRVLIMTTAVFGLIAILNASPASAVDYYWVGDDYSETCNARTEWACGGNWEDATGGRFPDVVYPGSAPGDRAWVRDRNDEPTLLADVIANPLTRLEIEPEAKLTTGLSRSWSPSCLPRRR